MPLLQGTLTQAERDRTVIGTAAPRPAYIADHPTVAGRYVLSSSAGDATAFLKASPIASAPGRFVLDSDRDESDRSLYLTTPTQVIV